MIRPIATSRSPCDASAHQSGAVSTDRPSLSGRCPIACEKPETKAVLVTGASSGIGRKVTERLAAQGYFVYAGARSGLDLKALAAIKNVQPVRRLDADERRRYCGRRRDHHQGGTGGCTASSAMRALARWEPLTSMKVEELDLTLAVMQCAGRSQCARLCAADRRAEGAHHDDRLDLGDSRRARQWRVRHEQARHRGVYRLARRLKWRHRVCT